MPATSSATSALSHWGRDEAGELGVRLGGRCDVPRSYRRGRLRPESVLRVLLVNAFILRALRSPFRRFGLGIRMYS